MTAPRLTLIDGGPIDGLASSRSGGVGGLRPPAPTPFPRDPGIGPRCPKCKARDLVRLQSYAPEDIASNRYGCRKHQLVYQLVVLHGVTMQLVGAPSLSEQLALTLAIKGIAPRGAV